MFTCMLHKSVNIGCGHILKTPEGRYTIWIEITSPKPRRPRTPSEPKSSGRLFFCCRSREFSRFHVQRDKTQQKTIAVWHAVTPSCQIPTSHWKRRCLKSELTSLLPVAMATAAFGKSPPTWGNSQVSPGNQNGLFFVRGNLKRAESVSAGLLCPTPGLSLSCQASQGCDVDQGVLYNQQVQEQVEQVVGWTRLHRALLPWRGLLPLRALLIHSLILAAHFRDFFVLPRLFNQILNANTVRAAWKPPQLICLFRKCLFFWD